MKGVFSFVLIASAACSSSSSPTGADGGSASTQPVDCRPITQNVAELDASKACYRSVSSLDGICRQPVSATRTSGLEDVCAAKDGALYRVMVSTDELLSGDGWTFGPRAAPDVVHQASTLSADDESRCSNAPSVSTVSMCVDDAGT